MSSSRPESPATPSQHRNFLAYDHDEDDEHDSESHSISLSSPPESPVAFNAIPLDDNNGPTSSTLSSHSDYFVTESDSSRTLTSFLSKSPISPSRSSTLDRDFATQPATLQAQAYDAVIPIRDTPPSSSSSVSPSSPPPLATYPPTSNDTESLAESFASGSSRKARPESLLIQLPTGPLILGVALVDFNHLVGPKIEYYKGEIFEDEEIAKILPFLALPDGAHLSVEDYSYFHIVPSGPKPTTLFGISCNRQIAASALLVKDADVTRSTVQKAVVVLASKPLFGPIRDKLGVITQALFNQRDFRATDILDDFVASLEASVRTQLTESGLYMGTNLRELVHTFRQRTLVLVKSLMLQKRILFYGHPVERLCTYQYSLVSLFPGLLQTLEDSGSPPLNSRAHTLTRSTSLKSSDHKSMMAFMGQPLDIFGKDSFFQPYLPLQQLDLVKDTKSWLCGTTNSIVTQRKEIDLLVNTETGVFEFKDPKLERLAGLTPADRKWMDDIVKDVNEGWIDGDPSRSTSMQFKGSDDYLRSKFEEYISSALSSVKYQDFLAKGDGSGVIITGGSGGESSSIDDYNVFWVAEFRRTNAYDVWNRITDPLMFDIIEPRHPCNEKPTVVSDLGLRVSEVIQELQLEQQLAPAREAVSRTLATGSTNFFKAVEGVRGWAAQRAAAAAAANSPSASQDLTETKTGTMTPPVEITKADAEAPVTAAAAAVSSRFSFLRRPSSTASEGAVSTANTPSSSVAAASSVSASVKPALSGWGAGIGSFLSSTSRRLSSSSANQQQATAMSTPSISPLPSLPGSPTQLTQHVGSPISIDEHHEHEDATREENGEDGYDRGEPAGMAM